MKKRWLAIVIIFIFLAIFLVYYLQKPVYNLTEKFGLNGRIVGYGIYEDDEKSRLELTKTLGNFFDEYSKKGEKLYFVLGNEKGVTLSTYDEILGGKINLITGKTSQTLDIKEKKYMFKNIIPINNKIEVSINNQKFEFELKPGENIYFVIAENAEGETKIIQ